MCIHISHMHAHFTWVRMPLCAHTLCTQISHAHHTQCAHTTYNIRIMHQSHHTCYAIWDIIHHTHHTSHTYHTCKTPPHPHHKCMQSLHTDLTHATQHNTWHTLTAHAHAIDRNPYPLHPHPTNNSHMHNTPHAHNTHTGHTSVLCTMNLSALSLPLPLILCPGPSLSPLTTPRGPCVNKSRVRASSGQKEEKNRL